MSNEENYSEIPLEFKDYVHYKFGSYAVKNNKNGKVITFGRFSSADVACAAAGLLIKHDWDMVDVSNDLIYSYLNKFWVFKLMNNKLIFDSKFDSYEKAVEYLEINQTCNVRNNDVLYKKKRKNKFKNLPKSSIEDKKIPNIYSKGDDFVVKYVSTGKDYGIFNSLEEACAAKKILVDNNWNFSSHVEMVFYGSFYWVFKIEENVLSFAGKFESYEDALDCLDSIKKETYSRKDESLIFGKSIRKIDDDYIEDLLKDDYVIESNFKKSIADDSELNFKYISRNSFEKPISIPITPEKDIMINRRKNRNRYPAYSGTIEIDVELKKKITRDTIKIKKMEEIDGDSLSINLKNLKSNLHIIKFKENTLEDYYTIFCSSDGKLGFSDNIVELTELRYVWNLLNVYDWDLNKISTLSSIHYFNENYYIIKVFNDKIVISCSFDSYSEAESNIEFLYEYYSVSPEDLYNSNIERLGETFLFSEDHNGRKFEISPLRSLEELKAIIDIFNYFDWDSNVFKKYDIFYYHGLYWEIDYFYYFIKLTGKFYSKEDALNHKLKSL